MTFSVFCKPYWLKGVYWGPETHTTDGNGKKELNEIMVLRNNIIWTGVNPYFFMKNNIDIIFIKTKTKNPAFRHVM